MRSCTNQGGVREIDPSELLSQRPADRRVGVALPAYPTNEPDDRLLTIANTDMVDRGMRNGVVKANDRLVATD